VNIHAEGAREAITIAERNSRNGTPVSSRTTPT